MTTLAKRSAQPTTASQTRQMCDSAVTTGIICLLKDLRFGAASIKNAAYLQKSRVRKKKKKQKQTSRRLSSTIKYVVYKARRKAEQWLRAAAVCRHRRRCSCRKMGIVSRLHFYYKAGTDCTLEHIFLIRRWCRIHMLMSCDVARVEKKVEEQQCP